MEKSFSNFDKMLEDSIILFDGVCNLCSTAVQFVVKHDAKNQFSFASLQSEEGKALLNKHNYSSKEMNTFVLIEGGKIYERSTAALRVAKRLSGTWSLLYSFIIVPKFLRDGVYKIISRNRYKWFGKKTECIIPTPGLRSKILN